VLDVTGIASASLREVGFFDVHPENDLPMYSGAWSNFPFFSSGLVVVSSIELGLFILRPNLSPISGADLIVSTLSAPALGGAGMSLAVTHATENQGGTGAPASVIRFSLSTDATLDASDPVLGTYDVPPLDGSIRHVATTTLTVPPETATGAYYIIAAADNGSQAAEEIENNNVRPRFIQIGPDLRITAFTVPATGVAGTSIHVSDTTSNVGGAGAADVITRLFLSRNTKIDTSDTELGVRFVPPLGPNETHSATTAVSIPAGTAAGVYYVLGHVDRDNEVSEISEINNTASRKITVQ
jgi:subtilase family serine protease